MLSAKLPDSREVLGVTQDISWVDFDLLESFMADVFVKVGIAPQEAKICADVLISSDRRGIDSHGIARLNYYVARIKTGQISPVTKFEIVRETATTAVVDGHNGMGQVISKQAMQLAIDKAKQYGMSMVAVRNSNHYGFAGYYPWMAIKEDMIGITGTNARPAIAPTFGVENMLGTNPLTIGFPTDESFPFVLDCATSVSQRGKIEVCARQKKRLPDGWVIDENGQYCRDAEQVLSDLLRGKAAFTPLGGMGEDGAGYKGYGYATVVEVLSAALQQGAFLRQLTGHENGDLVPHRIGHFFLAIDIKAFVEPPAFKKISGDIMRELRQSKKAPGAERIFTAGEKEHIAWIELKTKGAKLDAVLQEEILQLRQEFSLNQYHFPFEA
jgi:L-2-hydroxycarboxylate dehydrogenase (NAD+)